MASDASNVKVCVRLRPVTPSTETSFAVTGASTLAHVDAATGAPVAHYTLGAFGGLHWPAAVCPPAPNSPAPSPPLTAPRPSPPLSPQTT